MVVPWKGLNLVKVENIRAAIRPTANRMPKRIKGLADLPEGADSIMLTVEDGGGGETLTGGGGGGVLGREKEPRLGSGEGEAGGGVGGGVSGISGAGLAW